MTERTVLSSKKLADQPPRPAPRAMRKANSLLRVAARAIRRFERLAQTMSRISPTAAHRT